MMRPASPDTMRPVSKPDLATANFAPKASARPTQVLGNATAYYLGPALLVFATFGTTRRRELADLFATGTDFEIKVKLCIWALLGLIAFRRLPVIVAGSSLLLTFPLVPYVLFCSLALLSTSYSLQPALTGVRAGQLFVVVALAVSMRDRAADWPKLGTIYLALNWAFLIIGVTGLVPALDWRELPGFQEAGYDGISAPWRFGTPIGHFSIISLVAAFLLVARVARVRRTVTVGDLGYCLWVTVSLLLTVSRTGIIGAALGLLVIIVLRGSTAIVGLVLTTLGSASLAIPGLIEIMLRFLERGQDAEDLESLTGRTGIYESALSSINGHWLLGYGFRASRAAHINEIQDSAGNTFGTAAHAHNAVLESTASLGMPGALCAIAILVSFLACGLSLFRRAARLASATRLRMQPTQRSESAGYAVSRSIEFCAYWPPIFVFSMMDSSFALEINPFVFCMIAVLLDFTQHRTKVLRQGNPPSRCSATSGPETW